MSSTTLHAYQRPYALTEGSMPKKTSSGDMLDDFVSPAVELHRSLLNKKSATASALSNDTSASGAQHNAQQPEFAPFAMHTHSHHAPRCSSIVAHAHSHPQSRPCPTSSDCCLPRASFWNTRCGCLFSAIPDEILLFNVFSYLGSPELCGLAAVCSRWKFISTDPILWRSLDLSKNAKVVDGQVLDNVLARVGNHVNTLKLCNLKLLTPDALLRVGEMHLATNNTLSSIHFCSLKTVDFNIISALLNGMVAPTLREISLFGCINVDDACVRLIRRLCPRLEDLSVRGCVKITDAAFQDELEQPETPQSKDGMQIEVVDESGLRQLELSRSRSTSTGSESSVTSSSSSCSSSSSRQLSGRFAYLTSLNVANCKLLTEQGLVSIFRSSPFLQKLNLHGLNPTDNLLDQLSASCPQLHTLHLSSANPFGGNLQLSDVGVEYLAARLPYLQCLNLQGSSKITDRCIPPLIANCPQLEKLNLGGCFKLTDAAVLALCDTSSHVSKLTHVSLFQCVHLTDASIIALARSLFNLQHLDIHSCASLTDATLHTLMQLHSQLPTIVKQSLDDDEFDVIPRRVASPSAPSFLLPNLMSLDIGSCRNISKDVVAQLALVRPEIIVTQY